MKKYLADILTFARLIISIVLIIMTFTGAPIYACLILFLIGEITDAFDGTLSTKYPFPKGKAPKYRKYAAKYDIVADSLLAFAFMLFFTTRVNVLIGGVTFFGYPALASAIDFFAYGKLYGHPDDSKPDSLTQKNFPLAKRIILARRALYIALMFAYSVMALYASEWSLMTKNIIAIIGVIVSVGFWFFLSQRRHNISRDAVDVEEKLSHDQSKNSEQSQNPRTPNNPKQH